MLMLVVVTFGVLINILTSYIVADITVPDTFDGLSVCLSVIGVIVVGSTNPTLDYCCKL
jgi:hypothetical protein